MKILNIVSSENMTLYCHGAEVMILPSFLLPYGRLFRDLSELEIFRYITDVSQKLPLINPYPFAISLLSLLRYDLFKYDKIVVWHGESINDRLLFCMLCKIIKLPICEIIINIHNRQKYLDEDFCRTHLKTIQPISSEVQLENSKSWDRWSASDNDLRILNDNVITGVNIDYFDDIILKKTKSGKLCYSELTESISNTSLLAYSLGISSYEFIKNRIIYLADKGHLRPFKKEKGHWRISNLKDILPIKESENIKFTSVS